MSELDNMEMTPEWVINNPAVSLQYFRVWMHKIKHTPVIAGLLDRSIDQQAKIDQLERENAELKAEKDKAANICIAIAVEHNSYVSKCEKLKEKLNAAIEDLECIHAGTKGNLEAARCTCVDTEIKTRQALIKLKEN